MSYASSAKNSTLIFGGNGAGTSNAQLYTSTDLHLDSLSNSLLIGNNFAHNIVRYVPSANVWTFVAGDTNNLSGTASTKLYYPSSVVVDPMRNTYLADSFNHFIQLFYVDQANGLTIAGIPVVIGQNATTLNRHRSVRLDSQLNLYVL